MMSPTTLTCDQAIFTSVRTLMGEGYRIIAASRGVCPEEKQAITRYSPSHDALCTPAASASDARGQPTGAAFYPLSTGRLCVAVSFYAGSEHTGRGGQRVYTHSVIFPQGEFSTCGYNPFHVVRAMMRAGVGTPQLKPPAVLGELQLSVPASAQETEHAAFDQALSSACRCLVLQKLLDGRSLVVHLEGGWFESMEAWLMGIPGPMRAELSFSAGLQFSVGRSHRLQLLSDNKGTLKQRVAGQRIEYVHPATVKEASPQPSAWISFVDHHWSRGDIRSLASRTSRPFTDTGPETRERIGRLYRAIDEIPEVDTPTLLEQVSRRLDDNATGVEKEIVTEWVAAAQRAITARFANRAWSDVAPFWPNLVPLWQHGDKGATFAQPLIEQALRLAMKDQPITAAEAALDVSRDVPPGASKLGHTALLDEVLARLAAWAERVTDTDLEPLLQVCDRWRLVKPKRPIVDAIHQRCEALTTTAASRPHPSN